MKDLILITNYSPDDKRQQLLRNLVNELNHDEFDIMIVTHSFVPQDISDKIDFLIYEKENLLLTDIQYKYCMLYSTSDFTIRSTEVKKYNHGLAALRMVLTALPMAKNLNYVKVHHIEYDSEIKDIKEIKENSKLLDEYSAVWYKWDSFPFPTSPISFNLDKISEKWFNPSKELLLEFFRGIYSNTAEQYQMNLLNDGGNFLEKKMSDLVKNGIKINLNSDVVKYEWVVPVYNVETKKLVLFSKASDETDKYEINLVINGSSFRTYSVLSNTWILNEIDDFEKINDLLIIVNNEVRNYLDFTKINKEEYISKNKIIKNVTRST